MSPRRSKKVYAVMAYPVFTDSLAIVELTHHPLQLLLQVYLAGPLFRRGHRESHNPLLKDSPHGGPRATRLDHFKALFLAIGSGRVCPESRSGTGNRKNRMPLRKSPSNTTVDGSSRQVLMAAGLAADEAVEKAIIETSEEGGSEAASGKKGVGCSFS